MGNPDSRPDPADGLIGRKAVELGLITEHQLRDVQARLDQAPAGASLASLFVELGLLTKRQLEDLFESTTAVRKKLGKYTLVRQLGKGGMGVVYEAIDGDLGRTVALKMLLPSQQEDPEEAAREEERFVREARMSAGLPKHPGIVSVYESGSLNGRRYIAMEYIDGCHFGDWCKKSTGSLRTQVAIIRDTAVAVDHAHSHGIIHRDLKPANVLVDTKGHPHVTDFGLAKVSRIDSSLTLTGGGKVMGTPAYISPEQASGRKDVDRRTDVWSLGVMLYELLAGRPPFRGETPIDIMMKAVQNNVTPPSTVAKAAGRRAVDRTIENICLKALAKEPRDRYPNAKQFAADLTRWLSGEAVDVSLPRRKPEALRYGLVAGAVVAVLVVAALLASGSGAADREAAQKKARAEELVAKGQRHLNLGKYSDALVDFWQALEVDPENRAAAAGRQETERKIQEGASPKAPPPVAPPPPRAPPAPVATSPLERARAFARANPKDLDGQIRMWKEARPSVQGTPDAAEVRRELDAAQSKRDQAIAAEFEDVDRLVDELREAERFGPARDELKRAARKHEEPAWQEAVAQRLASLQQAVTTAFNAVRSKAEDARRRGDSGAVDEARNRVQRWKCPELSSELDGALARIVPAPPPPPPPPQPPTPPPSAAAEPPPLLVLPDLGSVKGHDSGIETLSFSPDGKLLVSAAYDKVVKLWSLSPRGEKGKLLEGVLARCAVISPDGKWIAAGVEDGTVRLWDAAKLQPRTLTGHANFVMGLTFSPDSRLLASAGVDGTVRIWDPVAGVQKQQFEGLPKGAMSVGWSPDSKLLAAGAADSEVKVWDMPAGRERLSLRMGIHGQTISVSFSPNSKLLATVGDDPTVAIWNLETGQRRDLSGHTKEVRSVAWSPDGAWIASASADGTLRIWEAAGGDLRCRITDGSSFFSAGFTKKGDVLAAGLGDGTIRFWDLGALRPRRASKD